jgi:hypothetical protein
MLDSQTLLDDLAPRPPKPYPGLRAFEPGEWAIFFGREPMIDEVITRLLRRQMLVVHGTSGCGKSSLIRAGVLPWLRLENARGNVAWETASMRPADRPLRNLARALAECLGPPPQSTPEQAIDEWHDELALGGARGAIEKQLAVGRAPQLCLLVDQFEEVFRFAREGGREEAQLFVELLCNLAQCPISGLFIVLTMRSDYIGLCAQFEGFAEVVDRRQYLLPRMDNLALLRAIHEPARLFGGTIDARVADRLLFAARREEDSLPILQHTLMRACNHAQDRQQQSGAWTVTPEDLEGVQGKDGALSTHAEEVLRRLAAENQALVTTAEWVFRSLADIDPEGRIIRRPCRLAELIVIADDKEAEVKKVIEAFRVRDCSFLMPPAGEELEPGTMIDVGHEALLRQWIRLSDPTVDPVTREPKGWLPREVEDGRRWRFLAVQAQVFLTDPGATLSPATTTVYERWWPAHNQTWAVRHARQRQDAATEYADIRQLWEASKRGARRDRFWRIVGLGLIPLTVGIVLILSGIYVTTISGPPILSRFLTDGGFGAFGSSVPFD